jgi:hypothetical protein
MEGVALRVRSTEDSQISFLLLLLIELLLFEAREVNDYRHLFLFLTRRINAHISKILQETEPTVVGEMVFVGDINTSKNASSFIHRERP